MSPWNWEAPLYVDDKSQSEARFTTMSRAMVKVFLGNTSLAAAANALGVVDDVPVDEKKA
jgi:hypothetical protein